MSATAALRLRPAIFVCDIQERFRSVIYSYPEVITTSARLLKAASFLQLPVYVTTQNRAKLGDTVAELDVSGAVANVDKTRFSMYVPGIADKLPKGTPVGIVGIESHICVLQTTIDLLNGLFQLVILSMLLLTQYPAATLRKSRLRSNAWPSTVL
ncbi:hypothetical protein DV452_001701 [Geotrichum candidum]|nr:hypothetical protein DV452_001701 [Geotrichum candidum]